MKSRLLYIVFILGILLLFSGQSYGCGGGYCPPCDDVVCPDCKRCKCGSCSENAAEGSACGTKWTCTICNDAGSCISSCESGENCCEGDPEEVCTGYCCYDPSVETCTNGHCCCAPNGCGPCDGIDIVPDNPTGCDDTSFLEPCDAHDSCYGTCADGDEDHKAECDDAFLGEVYDPDICTGMSCICVESDCIIDCYTHATEYYNAVRSTLGDSAYQAAQDCVCPDD